MQRLKVLIVEDSLVFQEFFKEVLEDEVFEKRFSDDGEDGLQVYATWKPDIILLDMVLPGMSGQSVLREIRKTHNDTATAVVVQTTRADRDDVMECVKLGIQGYVVKPPDRDGIAVKILQCYEQSDPNRAKVAQAELERVRNTQPCDQSTSPNASRGPEEAQYMEDLRLCLGAGDLTKNARHVLEEYRNKLNISKERAAELERLVASEN